MHICQKKRSVENFFQKCANKYFFVGGPSNGDENVTKFPPVVYDGYVKYEEAEICRSAIMQDFQNSEKKT